MRPHSLPAESHSFVGMARETAAMPMPHAPCNITKFYTFTDGTRTHTHAQTCHCEFCCGMHLTCKNTSIKPDRNGSVKGPERYQGAASAIASVGAKLKLLEKKFK